MIGSLFSGIGGLELGLERAGLGPVAWQVEFDPFCRRILAKHWPSANRSVIDVKQAGARNLSRVDLICGGFPCQDVSSAGKGAGLAVGTRSGLWFEFRRIVAELSPPVVVVENVANARGGQWLPTVRRDLYLLGYDTAAYTIRGPDVGCPQRRPRIFVVAHGSGYGLPKFGASHDNDGHHESRDVSDGRHPCHLFPPGPLEWDDAAPGPKPLVGGADHGISWRVDRVRTLGNAVVPQCAEVIGRIVAACAWPDPLEGTKERREPAQPSKVPNQHTVQGQCRGSGRSFVLSEVRRSTPGDIQ